MYSLGRGNTSCLPAFAKLTKQKLKMRQPTKEIIKYIGYLLIMTFT